MRRVLSIVAAMIVSSTVLVGIPSISARADTTPIGAGMVPVAPARLMDTRSGVGGPTGPVTAGGFVNLTVLGRAGVPAAGVNAVILTVTVTRPASRGYVTGWPAGQPRPLASSLNYVGGQTLSNQVVVQVGASGKVSLYSHARAHLVVDVSGYYPTAARFNAVTPVRLADTRSSAVLPARTTTTLFPAPKLGASATEVGTVAVNLTAVAPAVAGFLTAYPAGAARPTASNLNYIPGRDVAVMAFVRAGTGGGITIYNSASTDLVVDATGWTPRSSDYQGIVPTRVSDTRDSFFAFGPVKPAEPHEVILFGPRQLPVESFERQSLTAIEFTVTAVNPRADGYLTIYADGAPIPKTSALNFSRGVTTAGSVTVIKTSETVQSFFVRTSAVTDVVVDVQGAFQDVVHGTITPIGPTCDGGNVTFGFNSEPLHTEYVVGLYYNVPGTVIATNLAFGVPALSDTSFASVSKFTLDSITPRPANAYVQATLQERSTRSGSYRLIARGPHYSLSQLDSLCG